MRQVHTLLVHSLGSGQRLLAIALLWFVIIYAPVACIIHCHFFSGMGSMPQPASEFHCDLLHGTPTSHQHDGHSTNSAALPRILYDVLILSLLLLPSLSLLATIAPLRRSWPLFPRTAPLTPPPR
jgi:hypothetical protein